MSIIEGAVGRSGFTRNPNSQIFTIPATEAALRAAVTAAVAGNGDIIIIARGGIEVDAQIDFNKSGLMVIGADDGMNPFARGEFSGIHSAASFTDGPAAQVTQPTYLENLGFVSRDTDATYYGGAALLLGGNGDAAPFGAWVRNCRFPKWNLDNRIGIAIEGSSDCMIEDSDFEGVGSAFQAGIYVQGATQNLVIRNNHFRQCTAAVKYGVFAGGGPHTIMDRNIVEDGKVLDSQGNTAPSFLTDNYSELAVGASYDASVSTLQSKGIQFSGNHYSE